MGCFCLKLLSLLGLVAVCLCSSECHWNGKYEANACTCFEGFTGTHCQTDCHCEGHGSCKSDGTCECETGWKWSASQHKCVWDCSCQGGVQCIGPGECGCAHSCKWGACRNGQCVCYEGYKGEDCLIYDRDIMLNKDVEIGVNLAGLEYYSPEVKWVDVAKQSQEWRTQRQAWDWDTKEQAKITFRDDGYPASLPSGLGVAKGVYQGYGEHMPAGRYTVLYDGEGSVDFRLTPFTIHYQSKGRILVDFQQPTKNGIEIKITETNPSNPLRNLRFLSPGYEHTYERFPFHPLFLQFLKRFSELRFMTYQHTNGHEPEPTTWDVRRKMADHTQIGNKGGAIEYIVQIANWVGADPWVCVPHAADDHYVQQFATYVKQHLRPDLKVYVEWSNEVWNNAFRQLHYAVEQGGPLWPGDDARTVVMRYLAKRASEVADIWTHVWGSNERHRLVNVVGWQTDKEDEYDRFMQILGDRKAKFDALTLTQYFLCGSVAFIHPNEFAKMSMSEIRSYCDKDLINQKTIDQHYMNLTKAQGMKLLMYEGGPLILNPNRNDPAVDAKAIAFNRDSQMWPALRDILNTWYDIVTADPTNTPPGGLFNYFQTIDLADKWGTWGISEYTGQDLAAVPKWLAVQTFISQHWPNSPLGPKCSFALDSNTNTVYGCYPTTSGKYVCAKSADNGRHWTSLPDLNNATPNQVTLDGYDVKEKKVFVRVINDVYVSHYNVFSEHDQHWSTRTGFQYYFEFYASSVVPRMPAGPVSGSQIQHC